VHIAIVLFRYKPFGGYERQAALLADALLARGYEVTIVSTAWEGEHNSGLHFVPVPVIKLSSWLKAWSFARSSQAAVLSQQPPFDLTIAFDRSLEMDIYRAGNACHESWLATRIRNHGMKARLSIAVNPLNRVLRHIEGKLLRHVEATKGTIVVLSAHGARQIQDHHPVSSERFTIIPPGVDFSRFEGQDSEAFRREQRQKLGLGEQDRLLLHVGSGFRNRKGVDRIIRALPHLSEEAGKIRLIAIGADKKGIRKCRALAQRLGVGHRVEFPGGVAAVGEYYAAADCFLLLSMLETFGVVAAESLWFGLPTLVGSEVGAAGLVSDERLGRILSDATEPHEIAKVIQESIAFDQQAKDKGEFAALQKARRASSTQCDSTLVMSRYLALIEERLQDRSRVDSS